MKVKTQDTLLILPARQARNGSPFRKEGVGHTHTLITHPVTQSTSKLLGEHEAGEGDLSVPAPVRYTG